MNCSATWNSPWRTVLFLFGVLLLFTPAMGCDPGPPRTAGRTVIKLTDLYKRAERTVDSTLLPLESVLELGSEKLEGTERTVIRQHPAGTLRYRLRIPHGAVLRFGYCMAPYTWRKSPDGIRFHLRARRTGSDGARAARPLTLFSAALDPKNNAGHRRIFEQQVDLASLGGEVCELIFTLSHGPRNDVKWDSGFWIEPRLEFPSGTIELPTADPSRPDILLVTMNGLRADVLPFSGDRGPGPSSAAAPNIGRLAAEGLRASTAFTPSTLTIPSYASIITGAAPEAHGLHGENDRKRADRPTAGEIFAERGYRTAAFLGTSRLAARRTGLSRGFERYDCPVVGRRPLTETLLGLLDWIRAEDGRPSFCWLQVNELQPPLDHLRERDRHYYPRGGYNRWDESILRLLPHFERRLDLKQRWYRWLHDVTTTGYVEASYLGQVDEVDRQLGRVIDELMSRSRLKNTVVVITANHGLALGDQGIFYTSESLLPGVTRVPLIIRLPGRIPAIRLPDNALCTTADILPTLLGLLPPAETEQTGAAGTGLDLLAALRNTTPLQRRVLFLEGYVGPPRLPNRYALLAGGYKLTESLPGHPGSPPGAGGARPWSSNSDYHNDELFHCLSDPGEQNNLHGSRPLADLQQLMHRRLRSMMSEPTPARTAGSHGKP